MSAVSVLNFLRRAHIRGGKIKMNEHRPAPPHGAPGQPHHPQHPQHAQPHAPHAGHATQPPPAQGLQRPAQAPHPAHGQPQQRAHVPPMVQQPRVAPGVPPARPIEDWDPHRDSIALDDEPEPTPAAGSVVPSSKIKVQGLGLSSGIGAGPATQFKRKTHATGTGACRVRSFHGRLSDEGLAFMDGKINEWLDAHPEIEIKTVTTTVGMYDGKIREEALVVNIWY
jgi:hypothetical protein